MVAAAAPAAAAEAAVAAATVEAAAVAVAAATAATATASDRGRPARREELETHGRDGSFRSSVRIVHVDSEGQRKDREDERRAEREAKRQAEAERLAKLGY